MYSRVSGIIYSRESGMDHIFQREGDYILQGRDYICIYIYIYIPGRAGLYIVASDHCMANACKNAKRYEICAEKKKNRYKHMREEGTKSHLLEGGRDIKPCRTQ